MALCLFHGLTDRRIEKATAQAWGKEVFMERVWFQGEYWSFHAWRLPVKGSEYRMEPCLRQRWEKRHDECDNGRAASGCKYGRDKDRRIALPHFQIGLIDCHDDRTAVGQGVQHGSGEGADPVDERQAEAQCRQYGGDDRKGDLRTCG